MKKDYIRSIKRIKGWENLTDEEALVIDSEFDRFVVVLINGLPSDKLDMAIDEINRRKFGRTRRIAEIEKGETD
jgi:hypothetical protein